MNPNTTKTKLWGDDMDHLSGVATISTLVKDGLGALHLRLQVANEETRFMFSGLDYSRLISGKRSEDLSGIISMNAPILL